MFSFFEWKSKGLYFWCYLSKAWFETKLLKEMWPLCPTKTKMLKKARILWYFFALWLYSLHSCCPHHISNRYIPLIDIVLNYRVLTHSIWSLHSFVHPFIAIFIYFLAWWWIECLSYLFSNFYHQGVQDCVKIPYLVN